MKKCFAFIFALLSTVYLLTIGLMPDLLPVVDEVGAFLILMRSLETLGLPVGRFIPFFKSKHSRKSKQSSKHKTVDI